MDRVHLWKRGELFWIRYTLNGERRWLSLRTANKKIAEELRAEWEVKVRRGEAGQALSVPMGALVDEFIRYQQTRKTAHGCANDLANLKRFLKDCPLKKAADLTPVVVNRYLTLRRERDGIKPTTANRQRETISALCSYAVVNNYLGENPVRKVKRFHIPAPEIRWLNNQQIEDLLEVIRKDRFLYPVVATAIFAGLRRGELCWLGRADFDPARRLLSITAKRENEAEQWQPKTRRNRVVPVSPRLFDVLRPHTQSLNGSVWLFPSPKGCRWDSDNLSHRFRETVEGAGLPWNFLDLRHTFGSHLAQKGISLYKISKLMGNSPEICRRHYAAICTEDLDVDVEF
jgi:integrase